jgi:hypothetical protein
VSCDTAAPSGAPFTADEVLLVACGEESLGAFRHWGRVADIDLHRVGLGLPLSLTSQATFPKARSRDYPRGDQIERYQGAAVLGRRRPVQ